MSFLIRWLWKNLHGYRKRYILAMFLSVVCQVMFVFNPIFTRIIVDTFISGENAAENLATWRNLLYLLVALTIAVNLFRTALQYAVNMTYEVCSQGVIYRVRAYLFDNIHKQDASFYDYYRTGDIMTRLSGDIEMVRHSTAWIIRVIIESFVIFAAAAVFFFTINVQMALCMVALTPLLFIISFVFRRKVGPMYGQLRERLSDLNTAAEENISGNRVVKAFAAEEYEKSRFDSFNGEYSAANKKTALVWWKFFLPMETMSQSIMVVHLVAGGLFVIGGKITPGDYMAFSMLIWTMSGPMSWLGNIINDLQRFTASANKIIEVYYSHPKIVERADALELDGRIKGDIEFKNVSFGYGHEKVLSDISFSVKAGQTVAIMGETGSGKTTLVNLIPRVYDVTDGEITVDGHNIRMLKLRQLRSGIGMATQEVLLYSDTIEGNIAFGNSEMDFSTVESCAAAAAANEFIAAAPDGYETIIGERGVGLSGGQKQRIALARALAIKPSILILDDTTSAVDSETEKHIQESLKNLDLTCTKIIIAARISSAKDADKIIVLKDGKIAQAGTHEELLRDGGYYKEVYDLQS
ncbi:MAG: ABC transporter ATP-binding protein/permease [Oscillospiraceae bacterium]|jgi:ATP-binding cassette subfamily B protein|nr:ABC transporter ATP-binding protein/permease [Oscillospiraceae bacterium]